MTNSTDDLPGLAVPARIIPIPRSISPQARMMLAHKPPVSDDQPPPPRGDKAAWRARAAAADAGMLAFISRNAARYPATVTTIALADCPLYKITPEVLTNDDCALLYLHGGGFFMGGGEGAKLSALPFAARMGMAVYSLDYRMPPDHPFPAAVEDGVAAYRRLLEQFPASRIAVYGPSAGGNLAPATILAIRAAGLPLPAVCGVHSPAADLTECGDSFATNTTLDSVLQRPMPELMDLYADGHDKRDPLASPAFADYAPGFPPTILTTGTRDLLLSSTVMLHRQMRRGGVDARLHVWDAMTHAPFFDAPEEDELMQETCRFMLTHLGR